MASFQAWKLAIPATSVLLLTVYKTEGGLGVHCPITYEYEANISPAGLMHSWVGLQKKMRKRRDNFYLPYLS